MNNERIKDDIQNWWGDLYRQLYADHESLDAGALGQGLDALDDLFRRRRHLAAVEMANLDLSGKSLLEIGAGAGAHSCLFARRGAQVTAVDLTRERAVETARKQALLAGSPTGTACQADAESLPFADGTFDIVYSNGVLHHSSDTDRCVAEVHRILKPGGTAAILLYARHSANFWCNIVPRGLFGGAMFRWPEAQWVGRVTEGNPKFGETRNPITRIYSRREIENLFNAFQIVSLRKSSFQFDNFAVPKLAQARKALMRLFGVEGHPGGHLVYGSPFFAETDLELWLGQFIGFAWNIVVRKAD